MKKIHGFIVSEKEIIKFFSFRLSAASHIIE